MRRKRASLSKEKPISTTGFLYSAAPLASTAAKLEKIGVSTAVVAVAPEISRRDFGDWGS